MTPAYDAFAGIAAKLELACAQRDALHDTLGEVLAYVRRVGGFMSAEDQQLMRAARALHAECERCKEEGR